MADEHSVAQLKAALSENEAKQRVLNAKASDLSTAGPGFRPASIAGRLRDDLEELDEQARHLRKKIADAENPFGKVRVPTTGL